MEIIPAIDIIKGQCVRLEKGDYDRKKIYYEHPLEVAKSFEQAGIKRLHLVDLDGAKAKHVVNLNVLKEITSATDLKVDFGGGIKSIEDLEAVFSSGAYQVTGGSIAAQDPDTFISWIAKFGAARLILGADTLNRKIMVGGWLEATKLDLDAFIAFYLAQGIQYVICTDITKDGMMQGPSFDLYKSILINYPGIKLIASGGVTTIMDLEKLRDMGMHGAIIGKAIYEGTITLDQLSKF
ncbi:MAG: 1-(5-phosphoribosyl)-5-[(5-phosphoribosylamino)methylideneamino]imidazole-4-carboxamide isomerase [Flammeovirgaceae bacterium]|jgi:phosphoribosylformimino-5-aminoimidazole carboxamide ribotide isomerase|nr:1-(5-phosphoribosyl)-5-[(5-phosphoribosylamino)methylideneamino]imidazole-4-carboxamide isomerase [Flammeovirgaceae bacterium]|tara:strand:+ start:9615 stop:10328 length:714 start_codon:yes stop_codon:yes gene_type:complete